MVLRRRRSAIGGGGERERGVFVRLGFLYLVHFRCCVRLKKKVNANSKIVDLSFFFFLSKKHLSLNMQLFVLRKMLNIYCPPEFSSIGNFELRTS